MRKFNLRMPDELFEELQLRGRLSGTSMNMLIVSMLLERLSVGPSVGEKAVTGSAPATGGDGAGVRLSDPADVPVPGGPCDHQPYAEQGRPFCYRCGTRI